MDTVKKENNEIEKIKEENKKLKEENGKLCEENKKLVEENKKLKEILKNNGIDKKDIENLEKNKDEIKNKIKEEIKDKIINEIKEEIKEKIKDEIKEEIKKELKEEIKEEKKDKKELKEEIKEEKKEEIKEEKKEEIKEDKKEEIKEDKKEESKDEKKEEIKEEKKEEIKEEKNEEIKEDKNEEIKEDKMEESKEEKKEEIKEEKKEEIKEEKKEEPKFEIKEDELYETIEDPQEEKVEMEESKGFNKEVFISQSSGKMEDKYEIVKELGSGAFARCLEVKSKTTGNLYACKEIKKKNMSDVEGFKNELNILIKLDHPNIIKLYEVYENDEFFYLIMELCLGGELFDRIISNIENGKPFTEEEGAIIFRQMMSAINYCHKNNIVHRDLKPENLLCLDKSPNSPIKVIDFGMSKICDPNDIMFEKVGTSYYIAPEVLDGMYDEKCDIWSAGVILYILLCGYPCFNGETDEQIYKEIKKKKFDFPSPEWDVISDNAKNLIKKMLTDAPERISAEEVLKDPWVVKCAPSANIRASLLINEIQLKNYAASSKMRKAVLTYIASRLTQNEINELNKNFQNIDDNNDGKLTLEEIKTVVSKKKNFNLEQIEEIFKSIDTDGSGCIEYTEFISACMDKSLYLNKEKLKEAFNLFDVDHNGKISNEEIAKVLGMNKKSREISAIIKKYDKNKDGEIDFDEFFEMMKDLS